MVRPGAPVFRCRSVIVFCPAQGHHGPPQNRTCRFPASGSSTSLPRRQRSSRPCARPRPCRQADRTPVRARPDPKASCPCRHSISEYGPHGGCSVQLAADPFEWVRLPPSRTGHYPDYASTMSRPDGRISKTPPCLLGWLGQTSDTALPSSDAIRRRTRCGLRPRHAVVDSPANAYHDTGFRANQPLAPCRQQDFGAYCLHVRCG